MTVATRGLFVCKLCGKEEQISADIPKHVTPNTCIACTPKLADKLRRDARKLEKQLVAALSEAKRELQQEKIAINMGSGNRSKLIALDSKVEQLEAAVERVTKFSLSKKA